MGTLTLAGGTALSYSSEPWATSPAAAYSAWCAAAGISDTSTLQAIDEDDEAYSFTLAAPFFVDTPGRAFVSTEGGVGFYTGVPGDTTLSNYTGESIPNINRFIGSRSKPLFALTYHPYDSDLRSVNGKIAQSANATFIFVRHEQYNDDTLNKYDVAIRIAAQSIEMIGANFDTDTKILLTEWPEYSDYADPTYVQQALIEDQPTNSTRRVTVSVLVGGDPMGLLSAASPLGAPRAVGMTTVTAQAATVGPLGSPLAMAVAAVMATALAPGVLGGAAALASVPLAASASAPALLGGAAALAYHDFTGQLGDVTTRYVMDLVTPAGARRVPISSWQATLQTGSSNYVQCVVPACAPWVGDLAAATEFAICRRAVLPNGSAIEHEMARAPTLSLQFDRGPSRYTCTLSGYSDAFAADLDPPAATDRHLTGIRSVSSGSGNRRVRCAVDWLLRPGQRAWADGVPMVVDYINYYALAGDAYMDVGSRS